MDEQAEPTDLHDLALVYVDDKLPPGVGKFGDRTRLYNAFIAGAALATKGSARAPADRADAERYQEAPPSALREALAALVDRDFTFFDGKMVGASRAITQDEVRAARRALVPAASSPSPPPVAAGLVEADRC